MKKGRRFLAFAISLLILVSLAGCGSSKDYYESTTSVSNGYKYDSAEMSMASEAMGFYPEESFSDSKVNMASDDLKTEVLNDSARKLIKTYNMSVETEEFDTLMTAIDQRITALNGYVESLDTYNGSAYKGYKSSRYSNLKARIPVKNLDAFVTFIGEASNVTNKTLSVEDVTLSYVDVESKKATYEIEQERLLAMLEKCETVEDMITIESRLSEVRYKLESQESQLRTYDNLVDYATVYLYVSEVEQYTAPEPVSYWDEVGKSFAEGVSDVIDSLKNFLVWFVGALPSLVIFAIIVVIVVLIVKKARKSSKAKAVKKSQKDAETKMNAAMENAQKKANRDE